MWALIAGQRYKLTAVGPVREMEDMKASLVSLRPLTDTERKSFYVERLALAQLKEGESLDAFNERTANIWSVRKTVYMNGLYESRKPEAGRWLKLARRYPYKVVNNNEQK